MTGMSTAVANSFLDALCRNQSYAVTTIYIQLHVGDPGPFGTSFGAVETTRKAVTFGASSGGAIASSSDATWTNISGSEDATYFTAWDASTSGTFLFSGNVTANPYTAGDTYTIASGALTATLEVAT